MRRRCIPLSALAVALVVATAGLGTAAQVPGGEAPATPRSQMDLVKQLLSAPDQAAPWATDVAREHIDALGSSGALLRATATGLHGMDPASLEGIPPLPGGHDAQDLETLLTLAGASDPEQAATTLAEHPAAVQAAVATVLQATLEARPVIAEALSGADPVELATAVVTAREAVANPGPAFPSLHQAQELAQHTASMNPLSSVDRAALLAGQAHVAEAVDRAIALLAQSPAPVPTPPTASSSHQVHINTQLGDIIIAGPGSDTHTEDEAFLLIDRGGDDRYEGRTASADGPLFEVLDRFPPPNLDPQDPAFRTWAAELALATAQGAEVRVTIDERGNDVYDQLAPPPLTGDPVAELGLGTQGFGVGGGLGILVDLSGTDRYRAGALAQGIGTLGGTGMLVDHGGSDTYLLQLHGQGGSLVAGIGILADTSGNDVYTGGVNTQGVALLGAAAALVDGVGNDDYLCTTDPTARPDDGALFNSADETICHGTGSAGVAAFIDGEGEDRVRHQGVSSGVGIAGVGIAVDLEGNDLRDGGPHAYGVTTLGAGILVDADGDDEYLSFYSDSNSGGTEGLGFTFAFSHGAGAGGLALLVDETGEDIYSSTESDTVFARTSAPIRTCAFGCAVLGVALFHDGTGSDSYTSTMGQAAAFTGLGAMIDGVGDDVYTLHRGGDKGQAYVPPPLESLCSWALLVDGAGHDQYSNTVTTAGTRDDNSWWTRNEYALGVDSAGGLTGYALGPALGDVLAGEPYSDCVSDVSAVVGALLGSV